MLIECDRGQLTYLLRCWGSNRLRLQGVVLAKERPRLMEKQNGICPLCSKPLINNGKATHIDHIVTVKAFAEKVIQGELDFDEAYCQLWDDSNIRAVHSECNYGRRNLNRPGRGTPCNFSTNEKSASFEKSRLPQG
jgi:hypothetical protein